MAGFLSRLYCGDKASAEPSPTSRAAPVASTPGRDVPVSFREDLEVSGEAYYRDGIGKNFRGLGRTEDGVTTQTTYLVPEPNNTYDRNAVRVVVMGEQVGHVPQEVSAAIARVCDGDGAH